MTNTRAKVVHLSSVHPAMDTRIFHKECRSLADAGYDVTLIARTDSDRVENGVRIRGVTGGVGNRFARMTKTVWRVFQMALEEDADIYHFHDPELILVGLALKCRGKRVIYDVHESVPKQIQTKEWIPRVLRGPIANLYRGLEWASSFAFDAIVAATPGIASNFPTRKTVVVQNFVRADEFASIDTSDYFERGRQVTYVGGLTEHRGVIKMVDAMERTQEGTSLLLGGTFFSEQMEEQVKARPGFERVNYVGWMDRQQVRDAYEKSRAGLLFMQPIPNYLDAYPVKIFEYMGAGLPVVVSSFPFFEQFVTDNEAGLMVDPREPGEIARAIDWILDHPEEAQAMGARGRKAALERYSWENEARALIDLYRSTAA